MAWLIGNKIRKGILHSLETKAKMKLAAKGRPSCMFGKKHSEETKLKLSLSSSRALKGRKHSLEHRKNNGLAHKGLKWSEEQKAKLRLIRKRGSDHPNWRGGVSNLSREIRLSEKYKQWRFSIFKRDNFSCQICGDNTSGNLQVDHFPYTFAQLIKLHNIKTIHDAINCNELWDLEQNQTLCKECHKLTSTYGRPLQEIPNFENSNDLIALEKELLDSYDHLKIATARVKELGQTARILRENIKLLNKIVRSA